MTIPKALTLSVAVPAEKEVDESVFPAKVAARLPPADWRWEVRGGMGRGFEEGTHQQEGQDSRTQSPHPNGPWHLGIRRNRAPMRQQIMRGQASTCSELSFRIMKKRDKLAKRKRIGNNDYSTPNKRRQTREKRHN